MRKAWTDYVAEVRRKGNRGKKTMTHRDAMRAASVSWPREKAKLIRKLKKGRPAVKPPARKTPDDSVESGPE